jgi:hypothetical protein
VAQYVSEKVSDLSAFIFFLDTPQIRIQDVSNEYRYRIRIQVSDTLWVEVSVFHSTRDAFALLICPIQHDHRIKGCRLLQGNVCAQRLAQSCHEQLDLLWLGESRITTRKGHEPVAVLINGAGATEER